MPECLSLPLLNYLSCIVSLSLIISIFDNIFMLLFVFVYFCAFNTMVLGDV